MPARWVGSAAKAFSDPPPAGLTSTLGWTPSSGVRPCWSTVTSTTHSSPGLVPSGSELSPTVAHPPARAVPGAISAAASAAAATSLDRIMPLVRPSAALGSRELLLGQRLLADRMCPAARTGGPPDPVADQLHRRRHHDRPDHEHVHPVAASARSMPSRVPCTRASPRTRLIRKGCDHACYQRGSRGARAVSG